ncbi:hypothetical protein LDENG_00061560, partial [Lucifuga dentata]
GKGYKTICKEFGLHHFTVNQTVYKWKKFNTVVTLHRSGRPSKITPRVRCVIIWKVTKNSRETSKELKGSFALSDVHVNESTIRRTLNNSGVYGRVARRKPLLSKKNIAARLQFAKDHMNKPEGWDNVLWIDETKIELFGLNEKVMFEWLKQKKFNVLEWQSRSPDLNPIEILWKDLKWVVHAKKPTIISELKLFCKEERAKIPPS